MYYQFQPQTVISVHYHVQLLLIIWSHSLLTLLKCRVVLELGKDRIQLQCVLILPLEVSSFKCMGLRTKLSLSVELLKSSILLLNVIVTFMEFAWCKDKIMYING